MTGTEAGLAGRGVRVTFGRGHGAFNAVDAANINVREREVVGLVGESGSGKTTLGKVLALLQRPTLGEVSYRGEPLEMPRRNNRSEMRGHIQMIFQDPYSSLNPKQRALHAVAEVFQVWRGSSRSVAWARPCPCWARSVSARSRPGSIPPACPAGSASG